MLRTKVTKRKSIKRKITKRNPVDPIDPEFQKTVDLSELKLLEGTIVKVEFSKGGTDWQIGGKLKTWYKNGRFEYYSVWIEERNNSWGSVYFTDRDIKHAKNLYLDSKSTLLTITLK